MPWNSTIAAMQSFAAAAGLIEFSPTPSLFIQSNDTTPFAVTGKAILGADGRLSRFKESAGNGSTVVVGYWATDRPDTNTPGFLDGSLWEIQITYVSGATIYNAGPTLGSWLTMDSSHSYDFSYSGGGQVTAEYLLTIRDVATMTTEDTLTLDLEFDNSGGP